MIASRHSLVVYYNDSQKSVMSTIIITTYFGIHKSIHNIYKHRVLITHTQLSWLCEMMSCRKDEIYTFIAFTQIKTSLIWIFVSQISTLSRHVCLSHLVNALIQNLFSHLLILSKPLLVCTSSGWDLLSFLWKNLLGRCRQASKNGIINFSKVILWKNKLTWSENTLSLDKSLSSPLTINAMREEIQEIAR